MLSTPFICFHEHSDTLQLWINIEHLDADISENILLTKLQHFKYHCASALGLLYVIRKYIHGN